MKKIKEIIEGKKIRLRRIKQSDYKTIFDLCQDYKVVRYLRLKIPKNFKEAKELIKRFWTKKKKKWGIETKKNKKLIGVIGFHNLDIKNCNAEIGTWINEKYWGKGINTEAKKLLLDYLFDNIKLSRVEFRVLDENVRSRKALEKIGAKKEGIFRKKQLFKGKYHDKFIYSIIKEEYEKDIKKRLEKLIKKENEKLF